MSTGGPIAFYYGTGALERLRRYRRVVLQPEAYRPDELRDLADDGVSPLAYLALSEDLGPPAPWQRAERNPDWGGAFVDVAHPGWVGYVLDRAEAALAAGFHGLFLDTLDVGLTFPEDVPHLLTLVAAVRQRAGSGYLLANRGFGLLPRLAELVDGVLFESFTARWQGDGYELWPPETLELHARIAQRLRTFPLDLYALDYADTPQLADRARRRAERFGMHGFIADRALSRI